jgi:gamma-glutamyl-gamma-aminobutyrate hydrolase PuuD
LNSKSSLISNLLVISGGNTIPKFSKKKEDIIRHKLDNFFYKEAIKKKIPIIGICHGSQFLANKFGAILKKDNIHGKTRMHDLIVDSKYNKIYKVNSYHNISIKNLSKKFYSLGKTKENYIEYFKHKKLNITGIMWHPERNYITKKMDKEIIKSILK